MSTLKVDTITKADGTNSISQDAIITTSSPQLGRRNLIINGAMQVAQRGTSFSGDGLAADRFVFNGGGLEQFARTISNSSDAPNGFSNSIKSLTTTAETSVTDTEYYRLYYTLEGQECQHLAYGTPEAKTLTLSFYVKSNVTGTYAVSVYSYNSDKIIGGTYTIDAADTWEQKTISFVGDTTATIQNTNTGGLRIQWGIIVGPDRTGGSNSSWSAFASDKQFAGHTADWGEDVNDYINITGVQLEVGSVATPFEHRSYGEELALCQRYYQHWENTSGSGEVQFWGYKVGGTSCNIIIPFMCQMRSTPSLSFNFSSSALQVLDMNVAWRDISNLAMSYNGNQGCRIVATTSAAMSVANGTPAELRINSGGYVGLSAEL
jgi:hypothetical protein